MAYDPIIELYREAFRKHGNSAEAVLCPKGRQWLRFSALTSQIINKSFSILDYGCGLGQLKAYLDTRFSNYRYTGADLVPEFVEECRKNFPEGEFLEIASARDIKDQYDHIVLSGVFNLLYFDIEEEHLQHVHSVLEHLFQHTRISLSFDFMTDQVDFKAKGAFHINEPDLLRFVQSTLSKRYCVNHSYMPYEFSVIVYKDQHILRPDNVFRQISDADSTT